MTINIQCPACGKTLKAPAAMAGKRARCPNCQQPVVIPSTSSQADSLLTPKAEKVKSTKPSAAKLQTQQPAEDFGLAPLLSEADPSPLGGTSLDALHALLPQDNWSTADLSAPTLTAPITERRASYIAPAVTSTAGWRYWLFALTLLPLAFSLLVPEADRSRWFDSGDDSQVSDEAATDSESSTPASEETSHGPATDDPLADEEQLRRIEDLDLDDLVRMFPDQRLPGAHLSRDSWMHWLYALMAAAAFLGVVLLLFQQGQATPAQLLGVCLLTATCGVLSLIMFQWFATAGSLLRFAGIFGVFSLVIRLIGFSYAAAMNPDNGFLISLLGFTFGVGLCEEFIKAIPILSRFRNEYEMDWRGACVWGLASGVGFGVAEGIIYSSSYYNGIAGVDMYVVRFVSCVALHALWSASVGILLWHHQEAVRGEMEWGDWAIALLKVQGVVMLLHGLYDTLLKREMTALALLVALASFGFLAWLIHWTLRSEYQPNRKVRS